MFRLAEQVLHCSDGSFFEFVCYMGRYHSSQQWQQHC